MRDIGTWSNEQAQSNQQNRNKRYGNHWNRSNNSNQARNANQQVEELENDEEWQGDLTQTQIFTASTQKKENLVEPAQQPHVEQQQQTNDFPIGHFNAEEASHNIKKAVGIVSGTGPVPVPVLAPAPAPADVPSLPKQVASNATTNELNEQNVKQNTKQNIKYPPSSKPLPPPSTKIPKSAVIMPGGSSNSTNLDVQFGVDLDTPGKFFFFFL